MHEPVGELSACERRLLYWVNTNSSEGRLNKGGYEMTAIIDESGLPHDAVALWTEDVPLSEGLTMLDQPILTIHRAPEDIANGAACIVAPGGGYRILASDHEGLQVAKWLNRRGITCFVLRYRVGPKYHSSVSLIDGLRAVRLAVSYTHLRAHET